MIDGAHRLTSAHHAGSRGGVAAWHEEVLRDSLEYNTEWQLATEPLLKPSPELTFQNIYKSDE